MEKDEESGDVFLNVNNEKTRESMMRVRVKRMMGRERMEMLI